MIVLASPAAIHRRWVNLELGAALVLNKTVIPVCVKGQRVDQLPDPLDRIQGVTLSPVALSTNDRLAAVITVSPVMSTPLLGSRTTWATTVMCWSFTCQN